MTAPRIIVFATFDSPRLRYALEVCLTRVLGCSYQLVRRADEFEQAEGIRINYSKQKFNGSLIWIPEEGLLRESRHLRKNEPSGSGKGPQWTCFEVTGNSTDFSFDLLSASFYFLSRYEEYIIPERDHHQRFSGSNSLAHRAGCLDYPMVELWCNILRRKLEICFPEQPTPRRAYAFTPTYDIDIPWAYRNKGTRTALSWGRTLFHEGPVALQKAVSVWMGNVPDPYDCFAQLKEVHQRLKIPPKFFFPTGTYSRYDKNPPFRNKAYRRLIRKLAEWSEVGLHPSYYSSDQQGLLKQELERLASILEQPVHRSRQHYLRFQLPDTFRQLEVHGIRQEYSMGFADIPGFRAGISIAFPWYNLREERISDLELVPFMAMDVSLQQYQQLSASDAFAWLEARTNYLKSIGGTSCTLWHNTSLSDEGIWRGWKQAYYNFLETASVN